MNQRDKQNIQSIFQVNFFLQKSSENQIFSSTNPNSFSDEFSNSNVIQNHFSLYDDDDESKKKFYQQKLLLEKIKQENLKIDIKNLKLFTNIFKS